MEQAFEMGKKKQKGKKGNLSQVVVAEVLEELCDEVCVALRFSSNPENFTEFIFFWTEN